LREVAQVWPAYKAIATKLAPERGMEGLFTAKREMIVNKEIMGL
jgi:hypothetical protein